MEDEPSQAKILWQKMLVEFFAGRLEAAVRFGEKAIEISRRLGLKEQLAYCLNDICSLYGTVGRIADGFLAAEEARRLWIELGNQPMLTDVLSNVSFYHYFRGNFEEARKASEEAHSLSVRIDNSWGRSFSRMFIGIAYLDRGEIDQAMEAMHESLEFSLVSGFVVPQVFVRSFLGFTYAYLGQRERGLALLDEADLVGRARLPSWSFWPAMLRGLVELRSGHLPEAEAIFNPAGQPAPWTDEHNWLAIFMPVSLLLCHLELARANFSAALEQAKRLFQVLDSSGVEAHRMEALHLKGRALQGLGQRDEALQTARSAVEFGRKKELRRILWESLALTAELEEEHGDNVRAQALRQEARQVLQAILGSIPEADLRESFQCSPGVRGMLERTESSSSD
jgi:tetratricopeptide (TPR) repeat protein